MGWLALSLAIAGLLLVWLPGPGLFAGLGAGIMAVAMGWIGYRQRGARSAARLAGAGGVTVGLIAVALSATRYALTVAALDRLESLF